MSAIILVFEYCVNLEPKALVYFRSVRHDWFCWKDLATRLSPNMSNFQLGSWLFDGFYIRGINHNFQPIYFPSKSVWVTISVEDWWINC